MADIVPAGNRIIVPASNTGGTADSLFDAVLEDLNETEARKEEGMRRKLRKNYDDWAHRIRLLKEQFGEVWELFERIESKVQGWYRGSSSYGQWGFMGASGYGYNFGAGIHYLGDEKPCMRASGVMGGSKYLIVSFAASFTEQAGNGAGDERALGRIPDLDDQLIGLENCRGILSHQLGASEYMLKNLGGHDLQFAACNSEQRYAQASIGIGFLDDNRLNDVCQSLFIKLNRDELVDLPARLLAP